MKSVLFEDPLSWDYFHDSLHEPTKLAVDPEDRSEQVGHAIPNRSDFAASTDNECLYDHPNDSGEHYNLAGTTEFASTSKGLAQLLTQGFPLK